METVLISAGVACLIAAIVGGGLKAFQIEIPLLQSVRRQMLLAALGAGLLAIGLMTRGPAGEKAKSEAAGPVDLQAAEPVNEQAAGNSQAAIEPAAVADEATENTTAEPKNLNDAQAAEMKVLTPNGKPYRNATQEAQFLLKALGYEIRYPDGFEGPATTIALEDFQRKQQLPVSGAADEATIAVLRARAKKAFLRPIRNSWEE